MKITTFNLNSTFSMPSQKRVLNQKILFLTSQPKQTYVLGTQKNRLNKTVLMSTKNI